MSVGFVAFAWVVLVGGMDQATRVEAGGVEAGGVEASIDQARIDRGWVTAGFGREACREIEDEVHLDWAEECFLDGAGDWRIRSIENEHVNWFVFVSPTGGRSARLLGRIRPQGGNDCSFSQSGFSGTGSWYVVEGEPRAAIFQTTFPSCSRHMPLMTHQVIALKPDQAEIACMIGEVDGDLHADAALMARQLAERLVDDWDCAADDVIHLDRTETRDAAEIISDQEEKS